MATITLSRKALRAGSASTSRTNDWDDLVTLVNKLVTLTQELKTDLSAHVHGGVTSGAESTSAGATIAAADPDTLAISK